MLLTGLSPCPLLPPWMQHVTNHISIILADDHEIYLDGLNAYFSANPRYRVLALCTDGEQLVRAAKQHRPDIVVTDLKMPRCNGIEAIRILHAELPQIRTLVLTVMDHEYMIVEALEAGANGYVLKDAPKQEMFDAVEALYQDQPYYCRFTSKKLVRLISRSGYNPYTKQKQPLFSDIEKSIIQLMCEDKSVREMTQALFLSERTIEKYRGAILHKMNVKTVAGVAIYAIKHNLYVIGE
jgi:DNA-binding NarL/FixJ family response regulator